MIYAMSTSGDAESTSSSVPNSAPGSPRSRVKFLCSHGGKILPRPADGHLKYVGGETRVISVPYNITFTDLMKKLSNLIEGDVILKYQLIPEDLDALVTVKSDEDLRLMFEEYDRQELVGTPRLRTFLFPANPIVLENQMGPMDHHSLEQRYINSVNGIVFHPTPPLSYRNFRPPAINTGQPIFTINSACSSPGTPPETTIPTTVPEVTNPEITVMRNKLSAMPRARSSPNLYNLGGNCNSQTNHMNPTPTPTPTPISTLNLSIGNQQHPHHHHHYHQNHRQPPPSPQPQPQPQPHHLHLHPHPHPHSSSPHPHSSSPKPPLDPHPHKSSGQDHLLRQRSNDYYRHSTEHSQHTPTNHYGRPSRGSGGHMGYQRGSPYDQYYGNSNRTESPPGSPLARSPLQSNYIPKWDSFGGRT